MNVCINAFRGLWGSTFQGSVFLRLVSQLQKLRLRLRLTRLSPPRSSTPSTSLCQSHSLAPLTPSHSCSSAITQWEPRQPEPLLAWFDAWSPLLPRGACQTLLHSLVMPRIAAAVEAWDPTRETQPIHAWLHPWLPYLAPEMAAVYPTIRWVEVRNIMHSQYQSNDQN